MVLRQGRKADENAGSGRFADYAPHRSADAEEDWLFGYFGKFYNRNFGHITCYLSQRRNLIYIKTKAGKKMLISPDDVNFGNYLKTFLEKKNMAL